MITKEEFEEAVERCTDDIDACIGCPLYDRDYACGVYLTEYIKENKPTPAATGASSEILKNTNSIYLNNSTLLDIVQDGIGKITNVAHGSYRSRQLSK